MENELPTLTIDLDPLFLKFGYAPNEKYNSKESVTKIDVESLKTQLPEGWEADLSDLELNLQKFALTEAVCLANLHQAGYSLNLITKSQNLLFLYFLANYLKTNKTEAEILLASSIAKKAAEGYLVVHEVDYYLDLFEREKIEFDFGSKLIYFSSQPHNYIREIIERKGENFDCKNLGSEPSYFEIQNPKASPKIELIQTVRTLKQLKPKLEALQKSATAGSEVVNVGKSLYKILRLSFPMG